MSASTTSLQRESTRSSASGPIAACTPSSDASRVEQLAHDQALDRDADVEQVPHFFAGHQRHERAAVALALEQALVAERLDGGAHRRAGDAELAREIHLGQRRAGLDRAVKDLLAQRDDDGFGGGDRGDGESAHQAAISVAVPAANRIARVDAGLGFRARFVASPATLGRDLIECAGQTEVAGQLQHPSSAARRRGPTGFLHCVARARTRRPRRLQPNTPPYGRTLTCKTVRHKRPRIYVGYRRIRSATRRNFARGTANRHVGCGPHVWGPRPTLRPCRPVDRWCMSHSTRFARETDARGRGVVSRQPILDNVERIVGFELLTPPEAHPHEATASVLAQAIADIGLHQARRRPARVRGRHPRVPAARLARCRWTPSASCWRSRPTSTSTTSCSTVLREIRTAGFKIALDGYRERHRRRGAAGPRRQREDRRLGPLRGGRSRSTSTPRAGAGWT